MEAQHPYYRHHEQHTNQHTRKYDMRHIFPVNRALLVTKPLSSPAIFPDPTEKVSTNRYVGAVMRVDAPITIEIHHAILARGIVFVHARRMREFHGNAAQT